MQLLTDKLPKGKIPRQVYSTIASHIVVIQGHRVTEEDMLIAYDIHIDNIKKKQLEHQFQSSWQKIITINNKTTKQKYTGKQSPIYSCNASTKDKVTSEENVGTLADVLGTIHALVILCFDDKLNCLKGLPIHNT